MWRTLLCLVALLSATATARYDRIGFVSDPVELLLQDSYSSLKNKDYRSLYPKPIYRRQIRKRKYSAFPPTFFSSFGFGPTSFNRRQSGLPYSDLLFSGR